MGRKRNILFLELLKLRADTLVPFIPTLFNFRFKFCHTNRIFNNFYNIFYKDFYIFACVNEVKLIIISNI